MQIAGFWYYLFMGVFEAATIHYAVAKIFGPLLFGRGWCGYACWTAMVLDLLPFRRPQEPRRNLGFVRYLVFAGSLALVAGLFLAQVGHLEQIMFWLFLLDVYKRQIPSRSISLCDIPFRNATVTAAL